MIRLDQVSVRVDVPGNSVGPKTLLEGIDLNLAEARIGVIGLNGSGKSTLLRLFNGLILPTGGRVEVDGLDTKTQGRKVRARVGFAFTDPLSQLVMSTPVDDVELSLRSRITDRRARRQRAVELLTERGLGALAEQSIYDLSGGERQLVALVSLLAVEPSVLVADEPTTLLDLRNREVVREVLRGLDQQVIVATHDLELVADFDRVLVIDAGRVVADGSPETTIAAYRTLVHG
ncbi:MAG: ABC transporter ATP-binding protein [Micropruina sp.]|nr:ABC transporter ATP-binding protein [Micropruina sp.]